MFNSTIPRQTTISFLPTILPFHCHENWIIKHKALISLFFFFIFWTGSHYVALTFLELSILSWLSLNSRVQPVFTSSANTCTPGQASLLFIHPKFYVTYHAVLSVQNSFQSCLVSSSSTSLKYHGLKPECKHRAIYLSLEGLWIVYWVLKILKKVSINIRCMLLWPHMP